LATYRGKIDNSKSISFKLLFLDDKEPNFGNKIEKQHKKFELISRSQSSEN